MREFIRFPVGSANFYRVGSQTLGRYFGIYRTFFLSSLVRELEFRANFVAKVLQSAMWVGFGFLVLLVIYRNTPSIAGWDRMDSLTLLGVGSIVGGAVEMLALGLHELPTHVRTGTLDFVLTKPVDSQFWVSTRKFNFDRIGSTLTGVGFLAVCGLQVSPAPTALQWMACLILTACAILLYYSLSLFFMTLAIYWVRVDNLWVLGEVTMSTVRYPIDIYSQKLQRVFFLYVPIAFLASAPTIQLVKGFDGAMVLIGIAWTATAFIATRLFWRRALRSYSSASS